MNSVNIAIRCPYSTRQRWGRWNARKNEQWREVGLNYPTYKSVPKGVLYTIMKRFLLSYYRGSLRYKGGHLRYPSMIGIENEHI
jgi:hypothetical protein